MKKTCESNRWDVIERIGWKWKLYSDENYTRKYSWKDRKAWGWEIEGRDRMYRMKVTPENTHAKIASHEKVRVGGTSVMYTRFS